MVILSVIVLMSDGMITSDEHVRPFFSTSSTMLTDYQLANWFPLQGE